MSRSISVHQFAPPPQVRISPRDTDAAPTRQPRAPRLDGFRRQLGRAIVALFGGGPRRRVRNELAQLSDRELADIGLSKGDILRVFDPEFAAEHNARS